MRYLALAALSLGLAVPVAHGADGWAAKANRICVRDFAAPKAYGKSLGASPTTAQATRLLELDIAAFDRAHAHLAAIPRPRAQAARIARLLRDIARLADDARGARSAIKSGDVAKLQGWSRKLPQDSRLESADARALGSTRCALS